MLSKLLKLLMNFKKVQNQTSNEATINQKVNGNLKRKRRKHSNLWPSRCAAGKNEWAWADFFSSSILIIQHLKRAYAALKVQGYAFWSHKDIEWVFSNCFHYPHCNFQIWQTFQYAKDCLTEQDKSLTEVQKMIKICKLQGWSDILRLPKCQEPHPFSS